MGYSFEECLRNISWEKFFDILFRIFSSLKSLSENDLDEISANNFKLSLPQNQKEYDEVMNQLNKQGA